MNALYKSFYAIAGSICPKQLAKYGNPHVASTATLCAMTNVSPSERGIPAGLVFSSDSASPNDAISRLRNWSASLVALRAAIRGRVTIGYEDNAGFHFGENPRSNSTTSIDPS
jgi:hypothetical protein